eukprot:GHVS01098131.1.p3 GENE.GHVS01098131.1~~GHVS01098131.1.p3  ORF type:complete len:100 (+),score=15.35 GHVS01098131.1:295-594(+)
MQRETTKRERAIVKRAANEAGHEEAAREAGQANALALAHRNWRRKPVNAKQTKALEATWKDILRRNWRRKQNAKQEEVAIEDPVAAAPNGSGGDDEDSP